MALTEEKKAHFPEQMNELKEGIAIARGKMQADAENQYEEFRMSLEEAAARAEAENKSRCPDGKGTGRAQQGS